MNNVILPDVPYHWLDANGHWQIAHPIFCQGAPVTKCDYHLFMCRKTRETYWRTADSVSEYTGVRGTAFENMKPDHVPLSIESVVANLKRANVKQPDHGVIEFEV